MNGNLNEPIIALSPEDKEEIKNVEFAPIQEGEGERVEGLVKKWYTGVEVVRKENPSVEINGILYPDKIEWIDQENWKPSEAPRKDFPPEQIETVTRVNGGIFFHSHPVSDSPSYSTLGSTPDIAGTCLQGSEVIFHQMGATLLIARKRLTPVIADKYIKDLWYRVNTANEYMQAREWDETPWVMHIELMKIFDILTKEFVRTDTNGKLELIEGSFNKEHTNAVKEARQASIVKAENQNFLKAVIRKLAEFYSRKSK